MEERGVCISLLQAASPKRHVLNHVHGQPVLSGGPASLDYSHATIRVDVDIYPMGEASLVIGAPVLIIVAPSECANGLLLLSPLSSTPRGPSQDSRLEAF